MLSGDWTLAALRSPVGRLFRALKSVSADPTLKWDLRQIDALDSTGALLIWRAWEGDRRGSALLRPEHAAILERIAAVPPVEPSRWRPDLMAPIVFLGRRETRFFEHVLALVALVGMLVLDAIYLLMHPRKIPWREISATIYKAGALAMPVTALVGFLIGVVISYLAADTLKAYGAGVYIVNLLGISIIRDLVMLKLHLVEIEPRHAGKMPPELSGGMVKRVALARALALDPERLVLDEPAAGLDPDRSRSFVKLIRSLSREHRLTVFMVTHDVDMLSTLATRVAVLAEGHIVADGPLDAVKQNKHPFIASFFGTAGPLPDPN